jgi:hypothetical protein
MTDTSKMPEYEKLTRGVRRYANPFSAPRYRLWLAKDHLLHIRDANYTESYKRFYFKDIQAIVISTTHIGKFRNILFGAIAVMIGTFAALGYITWEWDIAGVGVVAGVAVLFVLLLLLNVWRGPTCQCILHTGVHTESIKALDRFRKAQRVLRRLQPLIEAAQGGLSDEQLIEKRAALPAATATRRVSAFSEFGSDESLRHDDGRLHALLFGLVLAGSLVSILGIYYAHWFMQLVHGLWYLAVLIAAITAIIRQSGTDVKLKLGWVPWAVLLAAMLSFMTVTVYGGFVGATDPTVALNPDRTAIMHGRPFYLAYSVTMCVVYAAISLIGFVLLLDFRRMYRRAQELAQAVPEGAAVEDA